MFSKTRVRVCVVEEMDKKGNKNKNGAFIFKIEGIVHQRLRMT
jgi:hypothetical protein